MDSRMINTDDLLRRAVTALESIAESLKVKEETERDYRITGFDPEAK